MHEDWEDRLAELQAENKFLKEVLDAREFELEKLREALEGYHNLAPALAEVVNESGEALLYSDLHTANKKAEEVLEG